MQERVATAEGVEVWIEFDDDQPVGADAKVRVFTVGAIGRKVWLKGYNRALERVFEKPLRRGRDPEPPTVWTEEADFPIAETVVMYEGGPLGSFLEREKQRGRTREQMEADCGRKIDPATEVMYPGHGCSVKIQVWR